MKIVARFVGLVAVVALVSQALPARAATLGACILSCSGGVRLSTIATEADCCSGEAIQCPPGHTRIAYGWGNPPGICGAP